MPLVGFKPVGGPFDELTIVQTGGDDFPANGVGDDDVGANIETKPCICPARRTGSSRVNREEPGPVSYPFEQMVEKNRVGFPGVGTPEQNDFGVFDLLVRIRSATDPKNCRQTDDAWGVSGSIATIDVVASHDHTDELLGGVVHLVGGFRATEDAKGVRAMFGFILRETSSDPVEGFLPACRTQCAVFPHHGLGQTRPTAARLHVGHLAPLGFSLVGPWIPV
jgi:hypothetical protein